jgi:hypothetical protein
VPIAVWIFIVVREGRRALRESRSDRVTHWLRIGAVTGLTAIALQSLAEFSLQLPGNAMLFAAVTAVAVHHTPDRRRHHAPGV